LITVKGRQLHAGEGGLAEQPQGQHRLLHPRLDRQEGDHQRRGGPEQRDDQGAAPALVVAAQEPENEQEQGRAERRQAAPVHPRGVRVAALAELRVGHRDRRDADRNVDEEHPLPAERVDQRATHERADRDRHADRGSVDPHRRAALAAGRELLRHKGQRHREQNGSADSLNRPGDVEEGCIGSKAGRERRAREDQQASGEDAPSTEAIGKRTRGEHECRERERVSIDHPLQVGEAGVQVLLDRRQRGVHHGDVEQEHERRHADREQCPPFALHIRFLQLELVR
jgi:hypothetical protein